MSLNIAKLLATLSQSARDQKLLARGRLVSPCQMADLPFSHDVLPGDAWLLVGELHPELFALLKGSGRLSIDVTLLEANIGIFYLVVRHAMTNEWAKVLVAGALGFFVAYLTASKL